MKGAKEAEEAYRATAPTATANKAQEESIQAILDDPDTEDWISDAKNPHRASQSQSMLNSEETKENKSRILTYLEDTPDDTRLLIVEEALGIPQI